MKTLVFVFLIVTSCVKQDDCNCVYNDALGYSIPKYWTDSEIEAAVNLSDEQKRAVNKKCIEDCE